MDESEKQILAELVKDPRISDNQIALKTNIPVKTVNRKRKTLEEKGIVNYYASIDHQAKGEFGAKKMYVLLFKYGVSRQMFIDRFPNFGLEPWEKKHIDQIIYGENNGHFALTIIIESRVNSDLLEIFNVELVNRFKKFFGEDVIHSTLVFPIEKIVKVHHNYSDKNMKNSKLIDENVFV